MIRSNSSAEETGEAVTEAVVPDPAPRPVRRTFIAAYRLSIGKRHSQDLVVGVPREPFDASVMVRATGRRKAAGSCDHVLR